MTINIKKDYAIVEGFLVQVIDLSHVGVVPVEVFEDLGLVMFNPDNVMKVEVLGAWNLEPMKDHTDEIKAILKRSI